MFSQYIHHRRLWFWHLEASFSAQLFALTLDHNFLTYLILNISPE